MEIQSTHPDPSFWMEVSGQPHEMAALPSEENIIWHPLNRTMSGTHSLSGHFGEEKNLLPLSGFEPWLIQRVD
jgi:hypothetical protein